MGIIGYHGDSPIHRKNVAHARHRPRSAGIETTQLASECRAAGDDRKSHSCNSYIESESRRAVDLGRQIKSRQAFAQERELARRLERWRGRYRPARGGAHQGTESDVPSAGRMHHKSAFGCAGVRRNAECLRRGTNQHLSCCGAGSTQIRKRPAHAGTDADRLIPISVVCRCLDQPDAVRIGTQFFDNDHGQRGRDSLANFRFRQPDGHQTAFLNRDKCSGCKWLRARRHDAAAALVATAKTQTSVDPHAECDTTGQPRQEQFATGQSEGLHVDSGIPIAGLADCQRVGGASFMENFSGQRYRRHYIPLIYQK